MLSEDKVENTVDMIQDCFEGATYDNLCQQFEDIEDLDQELFWEKFWDFVEEHLGEQALAEQLSYLRGTPKPRQLTTKEWIRRAQFINSMLKYMRRDGDEQVMSSEELVDQVIVPNIPVFIQRKFRTVHNRNDTVNEVAAKLSDVIASHDDERQYQQRRNNSRKRHNRSDSDSSDGEFENECKIHGGHEWKDCKENPINKKSKKKNKKYESNLITNQSKKRRPRTADSDSTASSNQANDSDSDDY